MRQALFLPGGLLSYVWDVLVFLILKMRRRRGFKKRGALTVTIFISVSCLSEFGREDSRPIQVYAARRCADSQEPLFLSQGFLFFKI